MTLRRPLLSATALCGSLMVFTPPALADCTDATGAEGERVVACSGSTDAAALGLDDRPTVLTNTAAGALSGTLAFGDGDDRLVNDGTITGEVSMGRGNDIVYNRGTIEGTVDLGPNSEIAGPGEGASYLDEAGAVLTGDIVGGYGSKFVTVRGTLLGSVQLGNEDDVVTLAGTVEGDIYAGGGGDTVVIAGRPHISGRVDAEGGDADLLVFSGDAGTWNVGQFGGFEYLRVDGDSSVRLADTWSFEQIFVSGGGRLTVGGDPDDGLRGQLTVDAGGAYALDGVHYGDVTNYGLLAGNGRISNMALPSAHLYNYGVVAPGGDAIGTFTVADDFHQYADGRLDIQLGAPGQSDLLAVGGTAYLDGTVNFIPLDLSDTGAYTFMTYGGVSGAFSAITHASTDPGLFFSFDVTYLADRAVVNVVKTGTVTPPPPPPDPTGCLPTDPASGSTVVCVPAISQEQIFTAHDLTIEVDGLLELGTGQAVLESRGSNGLVSVAAHGGVINADRNGTAVAMTGDGNRLDNAGLLAVENLAAGSANAVVEVSTAAGKTSRVVNRATGVIGDEGAAEPGTALDARGGTFELENRGRIHGAVLAEGESAVIHNGMLGETGDLDGPALIEGSIVTTAGADTIVNRGTVRGLVLTGAGDDTLTNAEGASIVGDVDTGAGNDTLVVDGALVGSVAMGEGDDQFELSGSLRGDADLGAGDDHAWIRFIANPGVPHALAEGVIDGGDGIDTLNFQGANGTWDAGEFAGFERLYKYGGGETTITGTWSAGDYESGWVESGTLRLAEGAEFQAPMTVRTTGHYAIHGLQLGSVEVETGGLVSGTGTIGHLEFPAVLLNHGTVAPGGGGIGTLTVWGDFRQQADGLLEIELGPDGASDLLQVNGTAQLDGAVQFVPLDAAVLGDYTFLIASDGVTGTFATLNPDAELAQQGLFFTYTLDYGEPDRVSVTVSRTGDEGPQTPNQPPVDPEQPAEPQQPGGEAPEPEVPPPSILDVIANLSPNQTGVREAFLAGGQFSDDLAGVRASLNGIAPERAAAALDSFSGEIYAVTPFVAARVGEQFSSALSRRVAGERAGESHGRSEARDERSAHGTVFWMEAVGLTADQDPRAGSYGYGFDLAQFALGVDRAIGSDARVGLAFGYSTTDLDQPGLGSAADLDSVHAGVYALLTSGRLSLDGQLTYARHGIDVSRRIVTGNASARTAAGETHADEVRGSATAGYVVSEGTTTLRPYGSLSYVSVSQDDLGERGAGDAGLQVADGTFEAFTGTIGLDARWTLGGVRPFADIAMSHDLAREGWAITTRMIGGGSPMVVHGAKAGRTAGIGHFGVAATVGGLDLSAGYRLELREAFTSHAATASLSYRW